MRAVVFDFDGVIVDSEPLHFQALRESLLPEGIALSRDEYYARYLAFDDRGAIRRVLEDRGMAAEMPRGIASGARHDEIDEILRAGGLREPFSVIVGADDVPRTKPDPAPYL